MVGNFIDDTLTEKLQLPFLPLQHPLKIQALDRGPIGAGSVTQGTKLIILYVSNHGDVRVLKEGMWNHVLVCTLYTQSRWFPPLSKAQKPQPKWSDLQNTRSTVSYLAMLRPVAFLLIGPMTVVLVCWLALHPLSVFICQEDTSYGVIHWGNCQTGVYMPLDLARFFLVEKKGGGLQPYID